VPAVLQREPHTMLVVVCELHRPLNKGEMSIGVCTDRLGAKPPADLGERHHGVGALVGVDANHDHAGEPPDLRRVGAP
jgi:hypothetical protein